MFKILPKAIAFAPSIFSVSMTNTAYVAPEAITTEEINFSLEKTDRHGRLLDSELYLTSVAEMSSFNLSDRFYGLSQFTANQNEFAIAIVTNNLALNSTSCIVPVKKLTATKKTDSVIKNQLIALEPSQQIFLTRSENFQQRIQDLTVKLDFSEVDRVSTRPRISFSEDDLSFRSRKRLSYRTSFSEEDRLSFRLEPENNSRFFDPTERDFSASEFEDSSNDNSNDLELDTIEYRFDLDSQARVYLQALGGGLDDFTQEFNSALGDTISRFGEGNPIIRQGGEQGIGLVYDLGENIRLGAGYTVDDIYDGDTSISSAPSGAMVNLAFTPDEAVALNLTYVHSFNSLDTDTGSERANEPFDHKTDSLVANSYGMELSFRLNSDVTIGSWVGLTQAIAQDLPDNPQADILNYAIALTWENIGHKDHVAGIVIGQPPKVIDNDFVIGDRNNVDLGTSIHLEGFFSFQATENMKITPGILVITNPEYERSNDTTYVGTIQINLDF